MRRRNAKRNSYSDSYAYAVKLIVVGVILLLPQLLLAENCCCCDGQMGVHCVTATPSISATATLTRTITPTPNATSTSTSTRTVTNTPVNTNTVTITPTTTLTPTVTNTFTPAPTPTTSGDSEQAQMFLSGISTTTTTTVYGGATSYDSNQTNEDKVAVSLPFAYRARVAYVHCTTAPGSGKTLTVQFRKNAANISGASCAMANVNDCNVTLTNDSTADFATSDRISFSMIQSVTAATSSECRVAVYARASGDGSEADAILIGGGAAYNAGATSVDFCGPFNATNAASAYWACNNVLGGRGRWIHTGGTLSGLSMRTDDWNNGGTAAGTFVLQVNDGSNDTDLTGQLVGGALTFTDTACTSNCVLDPGELVRLRDTQGAGNSSATNYRRYAWSVDGVGQQFTGSLDDSAASPGRFLGPVRSSATESSVAQPIAVASIARNLFVQCLLATNAHTITLRCGSTVAGMANTTLTCTTGTGANVTCSDTTHAPAIAAGDFCDYNVTAATAGNGSAFCDVVSALGPSAANTPTVTATGTSTPTATNTPTRTSTATSTPTPVVTSFDASCGIGDCATIYNEGGAVYPPANPVGIFNNFLLAGRSFQGGAFLVELAAVRWDTSAIPDGATILSCSYDLKVTTETPKDTDNRSITLGWATADMAWSATDYNINAGTDANTGIDITSISANDVLNIPLSNCQANVDSTGYTGLIIWVSGGQPTGENNVNFKTITPFPKLNVTYTP